MVAQIILFCLIATLRTSSVWSVFTAGERELSQDASGTSNDASGPTALHANIIVDDHMKVYADGALIGSNTNWHVTKQFNMPLTTEFVAIEAKNVGGPYGIRASFDGIRLVTDAKHWRCRSSKTPDWLKSSFDDSQWPLAKELDYAGNVNAIQNKELVNVNAKWIWTESPEDDKVYCRAFLDVNGYVQVDDIMRVYGDGVLIGTNNKWHLTKEFTFPGKTHVIAISGQNIGGPKGIRASFGGQKLVTSKQRWRCSNTFVADWEKPSFDDRSWPAAREISHTYTGQTTVAPTAKWLWGPAETTFSYCRAFFHMFATLIVDDVMSLYADGNLIGKNTIWNKGVRFRMPGETMLVAIGARNKGGPKGIKGFFAAGRLVTDQTWRCSSVKAPNWEKPTFDDSQWPPAKKIQYGGQTALFNGVQVKGHNSQWIWAADESTNVAYCRAWIRKMPAAQAVAGNMEDDLSSINQVASKVADNAVLAEDQTSEGNRIVQNPAGDNIAGGNIAEGNVAGGNIAGGNIAEGNVAGGNVAGGNAAESDLAGGNMPVESNAEGNLAGGNMVGVNKPVRGGYNAAGGNKLRHHRVFRKKRPMRGRYQTAGGKVAGDNIAGGNMAPIQTKNGHEGFRKYKKITNNEKEHVHVV